LAGTLSSRRGFVAVERIEQRAAGMCVLVLGDGREIVAVAAAVDEAGVDAGMLAAERLISALATEDQPERVHQAALRLLRYRARNERQLRSRLMEKGYPVALVDAEIERLRSVGLLDDRAYAAAFVEDRTRRSPKAKRLLQMELTAQGVERQVAREAAQSVDDAALAVRLAVKRLTSGAPGSFDDYVAKTGPFLVRRGFSFEVARNAMREAWDESRLAGD
jgi:regulatory protein